MRDGHSFALLSLLAEIMPETSCVSEVTGEDRCINATPHFRMPC